MNKPQKIMANLEIHTIKACAISLLAQLDEYDWLDITEEQFSRLVQIELDFHALVKEITE